MSIRRQWMTRWLTCAPIRAPGQASAGERSHPSFMLRNGAWRSCNSHVERCEPWSKDGIGEYDHPTIIRDFRYIYNIIIYIYIIYIIIYILQYIILYYTYTELYYIILYYIILYHIILYMCVYIYGPTLDHGTCARLYNAETVLSQNNKRNNNVEMAALQIAE